MKNKLAVLVFMGGIVAAHAEVVISRSLPGAFNPLRSIPLFVVQPPAPNCPHDPYREINGVVWVVRGRDSTNGWVEFGGKVLEVQPGGIRVEGRYSGSIPGDDSYGEFYVANFPATVAENDPIDGCFAKVSGVYQYKTVMGGSRTIHKLDYGTVYIPPPPTPEQIEAAKQAAAAAKQLAQDKKEATLARALAANQAAAEKGDSYGMLRMGERYRDGQGVPRDLDKARAFFTKALEAGSPSAQAALDKLK